MAFWIMTHSNNATFPLVIWDTVYWFLRLLMPKSHPFQVKAQRLLGISRRWPNFSPYLYYSLGHDSYFMTIGESRIAQYISALFVWYSDWNTSPAALVLWLIFCSILPTLVNNTPEILKLLHLGQNIVPCTNYACGRILKLHNLSCSVPVMVCSDCPSFWFQGPPVWNA